MNINDFLNVVRLSITKSHISECALTKMELHELIDKIMDGEDVIYYDDSKTDIVEDFLLDKLEEPSKQKQKGKTIDLTKLFRSKAAQ